MKHALERTLETFHFILSKATASIGFNTGRSLASVRKSLEFLYTELCKSLISKRLYFS